MQITAQMDPGQAADRDSVHLVQRTFRVSSAVAAAEIGEHPDLIPYLHSSARAEALEQKLIQQAKGGQIRIESGNIAEVVVIEIQFHPGMWIHAEGREVAP